MYNNGASPTLDNCMFIGNTATGGLTLGGGMYNVQGSVTVTDCSFIANISSFGGGGISSAAGSLTVANCTFRNNDGGYGGGMVNNYSLSTVIDCTFSGIALCTAVGWPTSVMGQP